MSETGGLSISWVDVFTDHAFAGNQLVVVLDADELDGAAMQTIARELGLSETIFVLDDAHRLRIFTPGAELPLAGHPVVGASVELARLGRIPAHGTTEFRTGVGDTPVEVSGNTATMTQAAPVLGSEIEPEHAARLLGVEPADVAGRPVSCSTGVEFTFVELSERATLAAVRPDVPAIAELATNGVIAWAEEGAGVVAQRLFAPKLGVVEDPATGVAAGALGALRVFRGGEPGPLTVHQGSEIGRPSTIHVEVGGKPAAPERVRVSGTAVLVMEGVLRVLPGAR